MIDLEINHIPPKKNSYFDLKIPIFSCDKIFTPIPEIPPYNLMKFLVY